MNLKKLAVASILTIASSIISFAADGDYVIISKESMTLSLFDKDDNVIKQYPIACGISYGEKRTKGEMRTPEGKFKIIQVQDASTWAHDFKDGKGVIERAYGPKFIRLQTPPHSGIGIHGTHDPSSIGTRASEGCIRMNNDDVADFSTFVYIGMPVEILSSQKDEEVNEAEGVRITRDVTAIVSKPSTIEKQLKQTPANNQANNKKTTNDKTDKKATK